MLNLKDLGVAIKQLEEERKINKETLVSAIEETLAAAYKKDYGGVGQIIKCNIDWATGNTEFYQVKKVLSDENILGEDEEYDENNENRVRYNEERHIKVEDAKKIQENIMPQDEISFPLEAKDTFGRIASKTAKNVILQKLREAERSVVIERFAGQEGEIIVGEMQRFERGNIFLNLGQTIAILPFEEQIRGERFRQGERVRAYVLSVDEHAKKGSFIKVSRKDPNFIIKLFEQEVPELQDNSIEVVRIERKAGVRTKLAVKSKDPTIDAIGTMVGQRGVLINTIKNELHNERIDVVEWLDDKKSFVEEAFSPAEINDVSIEGNQAIVTADSSKLWNVVGLHGQNIELTARITDLDITVKDMEGKDIATVEDNEVTFIGEIPEREGRPRRKFEYNEEDKEEEKTEEPKEDENTSDEESDEKIVDVDSESKEEN